MSATLIAALLPRLEGWRIAPICIVEHGGWPSATISASVVRRPIVNFAPD